MAGIVRLESKRYAAAGRGQREETVEPLNRKLCFNKALKVADPIKIENPLDHRLQLKTPVNEHQRIDEQLTARRPIGGVMIAEASRDCRQDRRADDARPVRRL